jgi:hypothetical protein
MNSQEQEQMIELGIGIVFDTDELKKAVPYVEAAPGSLLSFRPICLGTNHAAATLSMT